MQILNKHVGNPNVVTACTQYKFLYEDKNEAITFLTSENKAMFLFWSTVNLKHKRQK